MSPQDLHDYGAQMLQEMRGYGLVLDDPLLDDYINSLGYRLVASSERPDMSFTFFIVRDEQINAFAAPGGFIGVNAGLILAMDSEDELAAVLAHEISHVQQMHILRAFENTKKMSIPIMLGMLGVMIASAHSSNDTGAAAVALGTSLMQQNQINFTRAEETEADHVGIQTLARAGFDPIAMAGAFQTLQRIMRVNGVDVPEFLLDHPVDTKRIADAKARAALLGCPNVPQLPVAPATLPAPLGDLNLNLPRHITGTPSGSTEEASAVAASETATTTVGPQGTDRKVLPTVTVTACVRPAGANSYFELMRERARVLTSDSPTQVRAYYAGNLHDESAFSTIANHYGYALALVQSGQPMLAIAQLDLLVKQQPSSSVLRLALAHARDQAGDHTGALKIYEQLNADYPGNRAVALSYTDSLLALDAGKSAHRALELLRPMVERNGGDPDLQRSFGRANELAGDKVRAAEAYAEAAYLTGHAEDALNQLKRLSKQTDLTYYQRSRIDARIAQLTPAVLAQRKHDAPSEPDSLMIAPEWRGTRP